MRVSPSLSISLGWVPSGVLLVRFCLSVCLFVCENVSGLAAALCSGPH